MFIDCDSTFFAIRARICLAFNSRIEAVQGRVRRNFKRTFMNARLWQFYDSIVVQYLQLKSRRPINVVLFVAQTFRPPFPSANSTRRIFSWQKQKTNFYEFRPRNVFRFYS